MPRRGMGVEIKDKVKEIMKDLCHAPQGHGSRNSEAVSEVVVIPVMPRRGMGVEILSFFG